MALKTIKCDTVIFIMRHGCGIKVGLTNVKFCFVACSFVILGAKLGLGVSGFLFWALSIAFVFPVLMRALKN